MTNSSHNEFWLRSPEEDFSSSELNMFKTLDFMLSNIHIQRKQQGPTVMWKGNVNDEKWALCVNTEKPE